MTRPPAHDAEHLLDESEVMLLILSVGMVIVGVTVNHTGRLHRLYFRGNAGPGVVRAAVLLAMGWIAYVLWKHADPSVTGIYVVFYLFVGYAAIKVFGQTVAAAYGARTRIDVGERRNLPAALVIAAFVLSTGLIFGGSLWGEADPATEGEGGWWIPITFFLLGWGCLLAAFAIFLRREGGRLRDRIRRERNMADARAAATFLVASAVVLTDAVAGDFWGWAHGLLTFGVLAALLLAHEAFASWAEPSQDPTRPPSDGRRLLETGAYALLAVIAWGLNRLLDTAWVVG